MDLGDDAEIDLEGDSLDLGDDDDDAISLDLVDDGDINLEEELEAGDTDNEIELDLGDDDSLDLADDEDLELNLDENASTKLDLARAYIDMGDNDGAKSLLQEVISEGTEADIKEANELMEKLD